MRAFNYFVTRRTNRQTDRAVHEKRRKKTTRDKWNSRRVSVGGSQANKKAQSPCSNKKDSKQSEPGKSTSEQVRKRRRAATVHDSGKTCATRNLPSTATGNLRQICFNLVHDNISRSTAPHLIPTMTSPTPNEPLAEKEMIDGFVFQWSEGHGGTHWLWSAVSNS